MSRNALVVATISGFIKPFEMNDISILKDMGYKVHVATNIAEGDDEFFKLRGIIPHHIDFQRFPFKSSNFKSIKSLQRIIEDNDISLVHCHTPVGGVIARLAAKKYRKQGCKVIYTVHGLQFYKGAPKKDWLIYYPIEKYLSKYADAIVTINTEDYTLVSRRFLNKKTYYIPGVGVDLSKFSSEKANVSIKRKELGLSEKDIILFSVGELNTNKNHQIIIEAMSKIYNKNLKYFVAGKGPLEATLQQEIHESGLDDRVKLLGFRTDIKDLLKSADVFVLPSKREGLSVALMEAMASGLPIICSKIRGNTDLIDDGKGGYLCDVNDINTYVNALTRLLDDPDLRHQMSVYNQNKIQEFSINVVDRKMKSIYQEVIN